MRRWALVSLLLVAPAAAGDDAEPQPPKPVRLQARLDGPTARLAVRFIVPLATRKAPAAAFELDLPRRAAITGATVTIDGTPHRLALVRASQASDAIDAMSTAKSGTPAWVADVSQDLGKPRLEIYAPRAGTATIDLEIEAPTCFFRTSRYLAVPATWSKDQDEPELDASCDPGGGETSWLRFPGADLSQRSSSDARIVSRADRAHLEHDDIARVELDLASELVDMPRDLHTVFIVDGSRSMSDEQRAAEAAIIASYLEHAPHTSVQLVAFARTAHALLPAWQDSEPAARAIRDALQALVPRNGSNVDVALAEAGTWLARGGGTPRIVLFSDARLADRLAAKDPASWARLLPAGTLVHVVDPSTGLLERNDDLQLAHLAAATGGMSVTCNGDTHAIVDATQLVRPITLDHVAVHATGWTPLEIGGDTACKEQLAAGTSCAWWARGHEASGSVVVEGYLWGKKLARTLRPDPARARAIVRELAAATVTDEPLQAELERAALAVNKAWSLFVRWGGQRLPREEIYGNLVGSLCGCDDDHLGTTGYGFGNAQPPLDLHDQLSPLVAACRSGKAHLAIDLELTSDEIVDVSVQGGSTALRTCVSEAIWNSSFTVENAQWHATVHTDFD